MFPHYIIPSSKGTSHVPTSYQDQEAHQMFTKFKINTETNTVIKFRAHFTGPGPSPQLTNKITEDRPPVFGLGYLELYYWPISTTESHPGATFHGELRARFSSQHHDPSQTPHLLLALAFSNSFLGITFYHVTLDTISKLPSKISSQLNFPVNLPSKLSHF